jgi:vacuolar-type H+-ATPase subunit H
MEQVRRAAQRPDEQAEEAVRAVLAIERQTREMLAEARDRANRIVAAARERADELKDVAAAEADARAEGILERGLAEAQRRADEISEQGERIADAWRKQAEAHVSEAIRFVVDAVAPTEEEA